MTSDREWQVRVIGIDNAEVERASAFLSSCGFEVVSQNDTDLSLLVGEAPLEQQVDSTVVRTASTDEADLHTAVREMSVRAAAERLTVAKNEEARERPVLGGMSFQDLISRDFLVPAPFRVESGPATNGHPLLPAQESVGSPSYLTEVSGAGNFALILGSPGLGKSTLLMQALHSLAATPQLIFVRGRDLVQSNIIDSQGLLRWAIAREGRPPWPARAPIQESGWTIIFDGLDEWQTARDVKINVVRDLRSVAVSGLISCREHDYSHDLRQIHVAVEVIIHLKEWGPQERQLYIERLRAGGRAAAAEVLERRGALQHSEPWRELSVPLWLSLLANLAEAGETSHATSAYELLAEVSHAVAVEELHRCNIPQNQSEQLERHWANAAWVCHRSRRNGKSSSLDELATAIDLAVNTPLWHAVASVFEVTHAKHVLGFYHELFFEFYLARHIVGQMMSNSAERVMEVLSYQRSIVTNRFVREGLHSHGSERYKILNYLAGLLHITQRLPRLDFAKSQIVYFLARVDDRPETRNSLASIWRSDAPMFVRQSAAWGAIMLGDEIVEREYYDRITTDPIEGDTNRGYHLSYYGDLPEINEENIPVLDQSCTPAPNTLRVLINRLNRGEVRHQYLRRVELATIRQFLCSGRQISPDDVGVHEILRQLADAAAPNGWGDEYRAGIQKEIVDIGLLLHNQRPRQRIALVLRGGGVKGLAFAGALEVLEEYYDFEPILGTSAGAITAVLMAAGFSATELRREIEKTDFSNLLDSKFPITWFNLLFKKGLHSGRKLRDWISGLLSLKLDRETVCLRDLPKKVVIFANKVGKGTLQFDSKGKEGDTPADFAVKCSMALPYFFQPEMHNGARVVDGGLLNNLPIDQLEEVAAGKFVALYLGSIKPPKIGPFWPLDPFRVWSQGQEPALVEQYREDVVVINTDPIGTTDFSLRTCEKELLIARGRLAAMEFVRRKKLHRVLSSKDEAIAHAQETVAKAELEVKKARCKC